MATEPLTNPVLTMSPLVAPKGRDTLAGGSRADAVYSWVNRAGAAVLLVLLSPLMLAIAWRIWREDGAPVLFAHWRVGQKGRLFRCLKFRSMVRRADLVLAEVLEKDPRARQEWERDHKLRKDPRVLRIGLFLRQSSLDELPQLFNVLRGEMHLVGPRPVGAGDPALRRAQATLLRGQARHDRAVAGERAQQHQLCAARAVRRPLRGDALALGRPGHPGPHGEGAGHA